MKRHVNEKNRALAISLEKIGKKSGKNVWLALAKKVSKPVRKKAEANVYELARIAKSKANAGKVLVVPGKVLGNGDAHGTKIEVACMKCSAEARTKIEAAGGKVMSIEDLLASKPLAAKAVIVQ